MKSARLTRRAVVTAAIAGLLLPAAAVSSSNAADPKPVAPTKAADFSTKVPAPKLNWKRCGPSPRMVCAEVKVPLDYRKPNGEKILLAVTRLKAADSKKRLGSIFVNPGGPGGPAAEMALGADDYLPQEVTEKFDVIGMDPRGVGYSGKLECFTSSWEQEEALTAMSEMYFPVTKNEIRRYQKSAAALGRACSTSGKPRSASMSTAQVARDMDFIRRGVGDKSLNFLGFSYGSYLGQVYANLFPSKVRTMVIDGVIDPVAWAGTKSTAKYPLEQRVQSAQGAWRAQRELFKRCKAVGPKKCSFAKSGDPEKKFERIMNRLKAGPFEYTIEEEGWTETITYQSLVGDALLSLYYEEAYLALNFYQDLYENMFEAGKSSQSSGSAESARKDRERVRAFSDDADDGFYYEGQIDHYSAVLCTDGLNPQEPSAWVTAARETDKVDKYFGSIWTWSNAQCAGKDWKVKDPTRYAGPFTARTANPVLVIGNYWDPATNYSGAVAAAKLLPNSRLLKSDNWGHTAYGTSECTVDAVGNYLVRKKLPPKGTVCEGAQPFESETTTMKKKVSVQRPPVVPLVPVQGR